MKVTHLRNASVAFLLFALGSNVSADEPVRVAVFKGEGVGASAGDLINALSDTKTGQITTPGMTARRFTVDRITADEIRSGDLSDFDVLVHPGGSGSRQGKTLGDLGRKAVTEFVFDGGGYLGVCAGSYLATNDYTWSLNLIDAKVVDRKHWARGKGNVSLTLSPVGSSFFGHVNREIDVYYGQGPLLGRPEWDDEDVPDYQSLAIYKTEIAEKNAPSGVMPGTSAIVRAGYGNGRVFCFSPHPEMTKGREFMIRDAAQWLAKRDDPDAVEIDAVSEIVRQRVSMESPGGVAVLVTRNGKVRHQKGYGFVKGRHVTSHTPLRLASISKQFAAMCAAMLIEEGKLDLETRVTHYLPDLKLPIKCRELLVKDLLWHSSGLANFIQKKEQIAMKQFKQERGLPHLTNKTHAEWLATMEPRRAPGKEYEYTNSGYVLLARVIEVIAGEPFHAFQQRRIFDVLEMTETTDSHRFNGSGNMVTTLVDYAKWDTALWKKDPRLLSNEGYNMIFSQGTFDNGDPIEYGFGWQVKHQDGQLVIAEHGGAGSGTTAARNWIRRHFEDGTTVAFFAQEHPQLHREARKQFSSDLYDAIRKSRSAQSDANRH